MVSVGATGHSIQFVIRQLLMLLEIRLAQLKTKFLRQYDDLCPGHCVQFVTVFFADRKNLQKLLHVLAHRDSPFISYTFV